MIDYSRVTELNPMQVKEDSLNKFVDMRGRW